MSSTFKFKLARSAAAAAALVSTFGIAAASSSTANADPKQFDALVGYGSDTIENVTNAFAGFANNINYTPLQAGATKQQLVSWDATPDNQCFAPLPGSPSIHRPNGSGEGRSILSHADEGTGYGSATCGGLKAVGGMVDFARSSSSVTTTTGALTYIPFGRDAVSFAYYRASGGAPVTSLTTAQLVEAYTDGEVVVGGVSIIPCGIQTSSGTFGFWNTALNVSATENAATTVCRTGLAGGDVNGRIQENDSAALKAKGDLAAAGTQVIVAFSAANYIAKSNGTAEGGIAAGVDLGAIDALGVPYTGTTTKAPSATFYASTTFGRNVNFVLSTLVLGSPGEPGLKAMFTNRSGTAVICSAPAQATVNAFGFLSVPAICGSETSKGAYVLTQPS
jgi:hypothetical protein